MKVMIFILLALLFAGVSCEKSDELSVHPFTTLPALRAEGGLSYAESLNEWSKLKNLHGDSYIYHTTFTSFSGKRGTTELTIENGIVTSRVYQEYRLVGLDRREITNSYKETGVELGTHANGAPLRTIDDLYETCASEYLTADAESNTIYFQTAEVGLMTQCGFVPHGCMDDCFTGVSITGFRWLE